MEAVGRLVGVDADEPRLGAVDRADEVVELDVARTGNVSWSGSYQCSQNGRLRPTRFSHVRLCDSLTPSDGALSSGVRSSESAIPCA